MITRKQYIDNCAHFSPLIIHLRSVQEETFIVKVDKKRNRETLRGPVTVYNQNKTL